MLSLTTLWDVAQTTDFFEWGKLDFNRSMRMSPIFSQNACFGQPFYGMWPKIQTFSIGDKWISINLCEWVQYLAKTYAFCNYFTACGPNYRLFGRHVKNWLQLIYANEVQYLAKTHPLCTHFKTRWPNYRLSTEMRKSMLCATILWLGALTTDFAQKGEKWALIDLWK